MCISLFFYCLRELVMEGISLIAEDEICQIIFNNNTKHQIAFKFSNIEHRQIGIL